MVDPFHRQYQCLQGNPLGCSQLQQGTLLEPGAKSCGTCAFPGLLSQQAQIRGNRGIYEVSEVLGYRGCGRLYQGWLLPDRAPVVIREYLLPNRVFNAQETRQRKQLFAQMATLKLADGRLQDFRLITPQDTIADQQEDRCYLITAGNLNALPSLRSYLKTQGPMTGPQVRKFLDQVLQSLQFLHTQKFSLPNGQLKQGLTHGNLSLDTLLIWQKTTANLSEAHYSQKLESQFLTYLSDLSLWEMLFLPPTMLLQDVTVHQDLTTLGRIAFDLLAGPEAATREDLNLKEVSHWPPVFPPLRDFLLRLMGMNSSFPSAEAAHQALLRLPPEPLNPAILSTLPLDRGRKLRKRGFPWKLLLLLLAIPLLGALFWWLSTVLRPKVAARTSTLLCCVKDVSGVPSGKFTYTGVEGNTWSYILDQKNLVERDKRLETVLQELQPDLQLRYRPQPSTQQAFEQVRDRQADFLITTLPNQATIDLEVQPFAYDGLVVFVAFSYAQRDRSLPRYLRGQISFDQLRRLYTGEIQNWRELGGPDLPVKLYIPADAEAVRIFEERVLRDDRRIRQFRNLPSTQLVVQPTFDNLRQVIRDFEQNQTGSIAFATLSQVFGQCSVYPLALIRDGDAPPVQALIEDTGQPITPMTDLCDAKGSYDRNVEGFQSNRYPLAYPLAVVYLRDNRQVLVGRKFAEILQTLEVQRLLSRTGLVPLQPLSKE